MWGGLHSISSLEIPHSYNVHYYQAIDPINGIYGLDGKNGRETQLTLAYAMARLGTIPKFQAWYAWTLDGVHQGGERYGSNDELNDGTIPMEEVLEMVEYGWVRKFSGFWRPDSENAGFVAMILHGWAVVKPLGMWKISER